MQPELDRRKIFVIIRHRGFEHLIMQAELSALVRALDRDEVAGRESIQRALADLLGFDGREDRRFAQLRNVESLRRGAP